MPKLQLKSFLPLGIIAATLISVTMTNLDEIDNIALSPNAEPVIIRLEKPGAQVELLGPKKNVLELFEQKEIVLKLSSELRGGTLSVSIRSDEGLSLTLSQKTWHFEISPDMKVLDLPVSMYASTNGVHYLHIFLEHTNEHGHVSARALASEVKVGLSDLNSTKHFAKNTNIVINTEQGVISLPSKESIY